jgi:antagonist of KipI
VSGGIDVAPVLGSRSTYLRGGFGGFQGRALKAGDRLGRGQVTESNPDKVGSGKGSGLEIGNRPALRDDYRIQGLTPSSPAIVRAIRAGEGEGPGDAFFGTEFKVTQQSDRMGLRLAGQGVRCRPSAEGTSGAVAPGTVQMPPDGQPIVLMADAQTIGGYAQAAQVATADLPVLAQLKPGDGVLFREISLEQAQELLTPLNREGEPE